MLFHCGMYRTTLLIKKYQNMRISFKFNSLKNNTVKNNTVETEQSTEEETSNYDQVK